MILSQEVYYRDGSDRIALAILDTLAVEAIGLNLEQIRDRNLAIQDLEKFRTVLKLLRHVEIPKPTVRNDRSESQLCVTESNRQ